MPSYAALEDIVEPVSSSGSERVTNIGMNSDELSLEDEEGLQAEEMPNFPQVEESAQNPISERYKKAVSKKEIAKKFLKAMLGVLISSLLIYILLTIYNKLRNGFMTIEKPFPPETDDSLSVPHDIHGAVKNFIDKTKWE